MLFSFSSPWYVPLSYALLGDWLGHDDMGRIIYRAVISLVHKAMDTYITRIWGIPVFGKSATVVGRLATAVS